MFYREDQRRENVRDPDSWADCETCKLRKGRGERAGMGCGWLPPKERGKFSMTTPYGPEPTVCVGYSVTLPEVLEAGRALGWKQDGHLTELYDGEPVTQSLRDAVDVLANECKKVEALAAKPKDER